jgi:hypothetical protein
VSSRLYRAARWCVLVALAWATVESLPGLATFLRKRSL